MGGIRLSLWRQILLDQRAFFVEPSLLPKFTSQISDQRLETLLHRAARHRLHHVLAAITIGAPIIVL